MTVVNAEVAPMFRANRSNTPVLPKMFATATVRSKTPTRGASGNGSTFVADEGPCIMATVHAEFAEHIVVLGVPFLPSIEAVAKEPETSAPSVTMDSETEVSVDAAMGTPPSSDRKLAGPKGRDEFAAVMGADVRTASVAPMYGAMDSNMPMLPNIHVAAIVRSEMPIMGARECGSRLGAADTCVGHVECAEHVEVRGLPFLSSIEGIAG